jgi:DNA repair protein RecN (Recombination protein N)
MLQELFIRNFAIIDDLSIRFQPGLTVLSGETGAGKSIIVSAVNLLLGSRATPRLVRTGADAAELEALFKVAADGSAARRMADIGYDASEGLLIRRIISRHDRHRVYINGRLATLAGLSRIAENLASISGQHAHQGLLRDDQHLMLLDQFGALVSLRNQVGAAYRTLVPLLRRLDEMRQMSRRQAEHTELLRFQRSEIEAAGIVPQEDECLERERERLKNAEGLYEAVFTSVEVLYSAEGAVCEKLGEVRNILEKASRIDAELGPQAKRVADAVYAVEDAATELRSYLQAVRFDDQRLEEVEARLSVLARLKRKYGGSLDAVASELASIRERLDQFENIDHEIVRLEEDIARQRQDLSVLAAALSEKRRTAAERFAKKAEKELASLKMGKTRFRVNLQQVPVDDRSDPSLMLDGALLTESGIDSASYLIAPNVGEALKPMAAIASGGELSRVVLALKAILAESADVETVIFDEVDAGIGGAVAEVVGKKLCALSRHHQIICITHLPQIAKFANHHYRIVKGESAGRTRTRIEPVEAQDRVSEIARMLAGERVTAATLAHAQELLNEALTK